MSRCFPYPPPYLGEAEVESIKKEKERFEEAAKKERKREKKEKKKKEKKEKRSGKGQDLSKDLKKNLKRKYEELGLVEPKEKHESPQHYHKSKKPRDEHLENSDLTEEHGQPNTVGPACCESPERSQDSSKRRNPGSMASPSPSLTNSGSTIRIKLQSKSRDLIPDHQTFKLKGSVSAPLLANSRGQVATLQAKEDRQLFSVPQGSKAREQVSILQASKPRTASALQKSVAVSGAELVPPQTLKTKTTVLPTPKSKEPVVLESVIPKPRETLSQAPKVVPKALSQEKQMAPEVIPQGAWKSETRPVPSSSVARLSVSKEHLMKATLEPCARTQASIVKGVFQKPLPLATPKLRDVAVSPAINQDFTEHPVQPLNSKLRDVKAEPVSTLKPAPVVQQALSAKQRVDGDGSAYGLKLDCRPVVSGIPPISTDEPCSSGRLSEAGEKRKSKHHHKHSSSKRSKRKEAEKLFEDLITNWKPTVVDQFQEDLGDLEWLMSGAKKRRVKNEQGEDDWLSKSSSECKAGEGLLGHTNNMVGPSFQTWASYMPELDMYQLPYVVPF